MNNRVFTSALSGNSFSNKERISVSLISEPVLQLIRKRIADFDENGAISRSELNMLREQYIAESLKDEMGEVGELEQKVINSINESGYIAFNEEDSDSSADTIGQKLADKVASFGGSWKFIIIFFVILIIWVLLNVVVLANRAFDPYPFILLNLFLSSLAAFQAPIIMMSQNRQEEKDRARNKRDYMVNLKSEVEIRGIHEKLDHMLLHQQQKLLEIQQMQIELLQDILNKVEPTTKGITK